MQKILAVLAVLLVGACVSYGPAETDEFQKTTVEAVPDLEGNVGFAHSATWLSHTGSTEKMPGKVNEGGALMVTEKSVMWAQWDGESKRFKPIRRIDAQDIRNVTLTMVDNKEMIVVESKDLGQDAFLLVNADGSLPPADAIQHGQAAIQQLIKK